MGAAFPGISHLSRSKILFDLSESAGQSWNLV
jgi:hypothetical protein